MVKGKPKSNIINALLERLVCKNSQTLEPNSAVARSWQIGKDGKTYTFHLRENAR